MNQVFHLGPFSLEQALAKTEGDRQLLTELASILLEYIPPAVTGIQQAVAERNGPALDRQAHQLAGALGVFAGPAQKSARQLEAVSLTGNWDHADSLAEQLASELGDLRLALTELIAP